MDASSDDDDMALTSKMVEQIQLDQKKELTLLLLGETGVGKSTFINALYHYLMFDTLDEAAKDIRSLIPAQFTVFDPAIKKAKKVYLGDPDTNENDNMSESCTRSPKCHKFEIGDLTLNVIDTPGIGDTRGVRSDALNMQTLLSFIKEYKEINAICILLKPNNARVTVVFKYCIMELLKHLNKSASENIVFLFTNSRSTFYQPGDTAPALDSLLEEIRSQPPFVDIRFNEETTFCFDSESFRYLVAICEPNRIKFQPELKHDFVKSWENSVSECSRLIRYIFGLPPHRVQDTISVNNARNNILLLTKPLADIAKNINDNIKRCKIQKKMLADNQTDVGILNRELYIPVIDIVSKPLDKPITVCGDTNCCVKMNVNGVVKEHYKNVCHSPCYLTLCDGSVMGNKGLLECRAFNVYEMCGPDGWVARDTLVPDENLDHCKTNGDLVWAHPVTHKKSEVCVRCNHSYQTHLHTFYETEEVEKQVRDDDKHKKIMTKEEVIRAALEKIKELEERVDELKGESLKITEILANFAYFLKHYAIVPFNDVFENYIDHLIIKEKYQQSLGDDQANVEMLEEMLENYHEEKRIIEGAMASGGYNNEHQITPQSINQYIDELFTLKHNGEAIKQHLSMQQSIRTQVHQHQYQVVYEIKESQISKLFGKAFNKIASVFN